MKRSINDSCNGDCSSSSSSLISSSTRTIDADSILENDDRPHSKPKCHPNPEPNHTTNMNDRAARLEEEAPTFRSAPVVARPPSLASRGMGVGMGVGMNNLDRVPGDYLAGSAAQLQQAQLQQAHLQPKPQFEEPKDDIRKMMAADDLKPAPADAAAAASESNWTIDGGTTVLRSVPTYYPLEKSTRYVSGRSLDDITAQISDACRIMSVHAEYEGNGDVPVSLVFGVVCVCRSKRLGRDGTYGFSMRLHCLLF